MPVNNQIQEEKDSGDSNLNQNPQTQAENTEGEAMKRQRRKWGERKTMNWISIIPRKIEENS
jgi:hypothetical protein